MEENQDLKVCQNMWLFPFEKKLLHTIKMVMGIGKGYRFGTSAVSVLFLEFEKETCPEYGKKVMSFQSWG